MVIGSPMYEFNIPAILKNYIEHLYQSGITLDYNYNSLVKPKKIYIASSAGWNYKGKEIEKTFEGMFRKAFEFLKLKETYFFNVFGADTKNKNKVFEKTWSEAIKKIVRILDN